MKIVVISDSHGNSKALRRVFSIPSDLYIHLGDGERELSGYLREHPDLEKKLIRVRGNCDISAMYPCDEVFSPDGKNTILATHGHSYGVKSGLAALVKKARSIGANIVLYGHTHNRFLSYENGLYIMNPGSVTIPHDGKAPSFGVIELLGDSVLTNITDLK